MEDYKPNPDFAKQVKIQIDEILAAQEVTIQLPEAPTLGRDFDAKIISGRFLTTGCVTGALTGLGSGFTTAVIYTMERGNIFNLSNALDFFVPVESAAGLFLGLGLSAMVAKTYIFTRSRFRG